MDFKEAVTSGLKNYIKFEGRATRSEYWWFVLFCFLVNAAVTIVDRTQMLASFAMLGVILPLLGLGVRRLHDIDKSGWYLLLGFLPLLGGLALIYFHCQPGTPGPNRFDYVPPPAV
jgi:uncharacterized membrane protein YhaH (DUF805 family)